MHQLVISVIALYHIAGITVASPSSSLDHGITQRDFCSCLDLNTLLRLPCCDGLTTDSLNPIWSKYDDRSHDWFKNQHQWAEPDYKYDIRKDLQIFDPFVKKDSGIYRCIVETPAGNRTCISNVTLFSECHCKPIVQLPLEMSNETCYPGDFITFDCRGIVGPCVQDDGLCVPLEPSIRWLVVSTESTTLIGQDGGRISNKTSYDEGRYVINSTLTIEDVTYDDYGQYLCEINNGILSTSRTIQFNYGEKKGEKTVSASEVWLILMIVALVLAAFGVASAGLIYYYSLDIRLQWHIWFSRPNDQEASITHATIISSYSPDDVAFVKNELLAKGEGELGYKLVFGPRNFHIGSDEASYYESISGSKRLIFVISPDFLRESDQLCLRVFQYAMGLNRSKDFIYIIREHITPELWTYDNDILRLMLQKCSNKWLSRVKLLIWDERFSVDNLKALHKYESNRWLAFCFSTSLESKASNFWKSFRLAMPLLTEHCRSDQILNYMMAYTP